MQTNELLAVLEDWQEQGWIRALDHQFAYMLLREGATVSVAFMGMLVSHQVGRGHTCLSVSAVVQNYQRALEIPAASWEPKLGKVAPESFASVLAKVFDISEIEALPHAWQSALQTKQGNAIAVRVLGEQEDNLQPLVWDEHQQNLYLRRYWQYEKNISEWLLTRMRAEAEQVNPAKLREIIDKLMRVENDPDWQRIACANAAKQSFSVITGGPGTGKTYTVVRVLATLNELHLHKQSETAQPNLRIALAAPTGKAAARMQESVNDALSEDSLRQFERLQPLLNRNASTLHRLLGSQANTRYFRHNQENPLPFDVVVIDEASMIDTEMFDALLNAIGPDTRLILLGDKDQLAPVEAGSVLASICRNAELRRFSTAHYKWLKEVTGHELDKRHDSGSATAEWSNHIVMLDGSKRFTGITADIATAVNMQNVTKANEALATTDPDLQLFTSESQKLTPEFFVAQIAKNFTPFKQACSQKVDETDADRWALEVLAALSSYQLLTGLRAGPWGQRALNTLITQRLGGKPERWYHGRPVIVTSNDYGLNLNNGDIGVALEHPRDGKLKVAFAGKQEGAVRWVLPSRLTDVETVYAMTVHKSQGSEYRHAVLVLPDRSSPVLTKELIYTGVTRTKKELTLVIPNKAVWEEAIQQKIERAGGLFKN